MIVVCCVTVVAAPVAVAVTTTLEVPMGVEGVGAGALALPQLEMTEIASRKERNAATRMCDLRFVQANARAVRERYINAVMTESHDDARDKMNWRGCTLNELGGAIVVE